MGGGNGDAGGTTTLLQFKQAKRKVEYYASWCISHWEDVKEEVVEDLATWLNDWSSQGQENDEKEMLLSEEEQMFVVQKDDEDVTTSTTQTGIYGFGGGRSSFHSSRGTRNITVGRSSSSSVMVSPVVLSGDYDGDGGGNGDAGGDAGSNEPFLRPVSTRKL